MPTELETLYAGLDPALAPTRIYSFADKPDEQVTYGDLPTTFLPGSAEHRVVSLIQRFEAGSKGYDSVWAGSVHPLPKHPTQMTVCEVRDWQLAARKVQKSTAIGMYQIVGGTYRAMLEKLGLGCDVLFDAKTQDRFGLALLYGRGWAEFKSGSITPEQFGYELAGEWAAFPATYGKDKGYSRHRGVAGNRHLIGLADYLTELRAIQQGIGSGTGVSSEQQLALVREDDVGLESLAPIELAVGEGTAAASVEVVKLGAGESGMPTEVAEIDEQKPDSTVDSGGRRWQILSFRQ